MEESGEHQIIACGELHLDCVFHDLRQLYTNIEIKLSDPYVCFGETIVDTSSVECVSESANGKNQLKCISEPMEDGLSEAI